MTDKEKKMLPVLGVIALFAVYWLFIRGGGDDDKQPRRRGRGKPAVAKVAKKKPANNKTKPTTASPKAIVDAGVPTPTPADAAPVAPPQQWTIAAGVGGRIEWVATKSRVIKDDIVVKLRGYGRAERARAGNQKNLQRLQQRLNTISDSLRAAMRSDNVGSMRQFEKQVLSNQRDVERAEAKLAATKTRADKLAIRAPGSGVFSPSVTKRTRLKRDQPVGTVKE